MSDLFQVKVPSCLNETNPTPLVARRPSSAIRQCLLKTAWRKSRRLSSACGQCVPAPAYQQFGINRFPLLFPLSSSLACTQPYLCTGTGRDYIHGRRARCRVDDGWYATMMCHGPAHPLGWFWSRAVAGPFGTSTILLLDTWMNAAAAVCTRVGTKACASA